MPLYSLSSILTLLLDLMKDIDAYYYGYIDDEDGILMPLEVAAEKKGKFNYFSS